MIRSLPNPTGDVLLEPTPLPSDAVIPQFRTVAGRYYAAMETIGAALLASLSRGLGIAPALFRDAFTEGISTLRLLRYIPRHDLPISDVLKTTRGAHVDTGMLTLLAPVNGALGLEVEVKQGNWLRVPAEEGTLVVNFGGLLERWTGGLIKAPMFTFSLRLRHQLRLFINAPYQDLSQDPLLGHLLYAQPALC